MTTQEIKKYISLNFLSKKGKIKYSTLTLENLEETTMVSLQKWKKGFYTNLLKFQAVKENGFKFVLKVY